MNKLKKMFEKTSNLVKKGVNKVNALAYSALFGVATALASVQGYALPDENISMDTLVTNIITQITNIFRYIGILLLVWGIGQLVLAFKNEDADSKSRAMMLIMTSVALITLKTILSSVGLI